MRITTLLTLFLMLLFPLGTVYAADGPDGSIHITSDRLDVYDDKGIVLFPEMLWLLRILPWLIRTNSFFTMTRKMVRESHFPVS